MTTPSWRRYLTFWKPDVRRDVDDELRFHLDERTSDLIVEGLTPAEAARRAAPSSATSIRSAQDFAISTSASSPTVHARNGEAS